MRIVYPNPERCIGCKQCEHGCAVEHSVSRDAVAALSEDPPPRARVHARAGAVFGTSIPAKCRHCQPAPCAEACPVGAIFRAGDGTVLVEAALCISCGICGAVCPFFALTYHRTQEQPIRSVAVKCDNCRPRVASGHPPACVAACKTGALVFGEPDFALTATSEAQHPEGEALLTALRAFGESITALSRPAT